MWRAALILVLAASSAIAASLQQSRRERQTDTCGYSSCPSFSNDPGIVNVHLVPHSHDDVGWLKTVDQYFFGSSNDIATGGVQYIIDSVISELSLDPTRRFIQVETGFFWPWWNEQNENIKATVRQLISEGRLEIAGGGWSMADEGASHYSAFVDNTAIGLNYMKDALGLCATPRVAWQIDPFGHSREEASLFAQMGLDAVFFARIDVRDKNQRKDDGTLEIVWEGTDHLGEETSLFTSIFPDHYSPPSGFCFDHRCGSNDPPIMDDPRIEEYNLDEELALFQLRIRQYLSYHSDGRTHIMFNMGDDFHYENAHLNFKNMDKLIKYMNERTDYNVFYSTPSCYALALSQDGDGTEVQEWPTKTDDFFPYADGSHNYWTGYFTSRSSFKFHERQSNSLLQAAKQLNAFTTLDTQEEGIAYLAQAMAISQHHDAITGTAKTAVDHDYNLRLG